MHREAISNMNEIFVNKKKNKTTIGIFGKSGEGKSSLLSAILGEEDLLPSGSFGACTAVVTQVEANLNDSNYIAEIELITKEVLLFSFIRFVICASFNMTSASPCFFYWMPCVFAGVGKRSSRSF